MGRPRKYCDNCGVIVNRKKTRARMMRRRNLGTSDFYEHRMKDFLRESEECRKELSKMGIKRQFT
jgi:hypothetical protein